MMQRWSKHLTDTLRTLGRRGALFVMATVTAVTFALTPVMTQPAHAQLQGLSALGGSFTNGLSSCAIETVGWVICPTMRSIARLADYGFAYINKSFLRIDSNISNTSSGTFTAWRTMQGIANALFVIAFMSLIYSQLTGRNSGGYNIKRLLPRLVIAAIAINLSFYICAILVEISNILGDSLLVIMNGLAKGIGTPIMPINMDSGGGPSTGSDGVLVTIASQIMGRSSVAWVLMAPIAAVTITIATLCGATIVLLIMRKTIIAVLMLASPVLFVAYLLPNLERFFFQAFRLFIQLLLLYPILAMLLGAGQIVSTTISATGNNDANYKTTNDWYTKLTPGARGSAIIDLTASAAAVLPILGAWFLFKNSSSIMNSAGTRLSATLAGRRGDKEARVAGRAVEGASSAKNATGLANPLNRRQAYTRGRRRASLAGSTLTESRNSPNGSSLQPGTNRGTGLADKNIGSNPFAGQAGSVDETNLSDIANTPNTSSTTNRSELNNLANQIDQKGAGEKVATAIFGAKGRDKDDKQVTAKDLFNSLNRDRTGHSSKDKDRQFGAGPAPAGGGQSPASNSGPVAPTTGYRAPQIAQSTSIVSGAAAGSVPAQIVAVPVQVDASTLLGQNSGAPISDMVKQPVTGTEKDAEARANKYLFDAQRDIDDARDKQDILGRKDSEPLTEQPHLTVDVDGKDHTD